MNTFLKNTLGVTVVNKSKGKRKGEGIYIIKGIEVWKEVKITIPKNSKAEFLDELKRHKEQRPKMLKTKISRWDSILEKFIIETKETQVK